MPGGVTTFTGEFFRWTGEFWIWTGELCRWMGEGCTLLGACCTWAGGVKVEGIILAGEMSPVSCSGGGGGAGACRGDSSPDSTEDTCPGPAREPRLGTWPPWPELSSRWFAVWMMDELICGSAAVFSWCLVFCCSCNKNIFKLAKNICT